MSGEKRSVLVLYPGAVASIAAALDGVPVEHRQDVLHAFLSETTEAGGYMRVRGARVTSREYFTAARALGTFSTVTLAKEAGASRGCAAAWIGNMFKEKRIRRVERGWYAADLMEGDR